MRPFFVGAADEINMVLARAGAGEFRVASPDGPGDYLRAVIAQLTCDFGKEAVVANHHPDLAKARIEDGIIAARRDATFDFTARQTGFPIFTCDLAIRADEHGHVEQQMPIAFDEAGHDIEA